ncbi:cell division protein ZipA C-terminal FtsZ-binding domain-containing protein [Alcaligenes sp. WGS1538]|uniref:cell division protein ZipA C-terminal FtsZ-binding domain-containing protein n=1 Tax=Alcaligenes sp. WGS1538 TaxID=3366811 RepID=UPI00372CF672
MSDLQIALILLGILLILLVVVFNWWQDRRIRQQMQSQFPDGDTDPLMSQLSEAERREPSMGRGEPASADGEHDAAEVDCTTEAVIDISFSQPVQAQALAQALQGVQRVGGKPVRYFAECEGGGHRARLRAGESYSSMQLAVLLANRSGPLSAIEWSQLWTAAQSLAQQFDASVEGPEQNDVLRRAAALDNACADLDALVGISVRLPGPLPASKVIQAVRDAGFLPYGQQLAWLADSGQPRFTAMFDSANPNDIQSASVERIDLLLDLPNSPADDHAFSRMATVARDLAGRLDGVVLDDQGRPLPESADQNIDEQLSNLYRRLDEAGFTAGQERTGRVFS